MYRILIEVRPHASLLFLLSISAALAGCGDAPSQGAAQRPSSLGSYETFHQGSGCLGCHDLHQGGMGGSNLSMVLDSVSTPQSGNRSVVFQARSGSKSYADGDGTYDGICEVCHTQTAHHRNDASGDHAHYAGQDCLACHKHADEFRATFDPSRHVATPGSGAIAIFADDDHDDAGWVGPKPYFDIPVDCSLCHRTELLPVHGNRCATCHPTAVSSLGSWNKTCSQGACHPTIHGDVFPAHWPFSGTTGSACNTCHEAATWAVPQSNCLNCHASYLPSDTTPPVTTSDAKTTYVGAAVIDFVITDSGKVGLGTTFYKLDGGAEQVGSKVIVSSAGAHTLEFWSMDQAGNTETTKHQASFSVTADTTAPVTTSNAASAYYQVATITLSATDASTQGVKATYYRLDGGSVQTGTTVFVPGVSGVVPHVLEFWSEDWSGNVETTKTANFTITAGTATIRLVWGTADQGNPPADPSDYAYWYVRRNNASGYLAASGSGANPGWSGVDDVVVPVSAVPYYVDIWWWDSQYGYEDNTVFPSVPVKVPGEIIRLSY